MLTVRGGILDFRFSLPRTEILGWSRGKGMRKPVGIIGGGNMGEALIAGVLQSGLLSPEEILFFEPRMDRRD